MDEITYDQFEKVDIRIGTVTKAEVPEWSHWVMKLEVDFGDPPTGGGKRTIFSGIMKFYAPEDLEGKQFPFVVNLKPKRIGPPNDAGEYNYSQGMMIMTVPTDDPTDEETKPILFNLSEKVPSGAKVR